MPAECLHADSLGCSQPTLPARLALQGTASPDPSGRSSSSNARRLDELAQLKRSATERSNKAYMMQQQSERRGLLGILLVACQACCSCWRDCAPAQSPAACLLSAGGSFSSHGPGAAAASAPGSAAALAAAAASADEERIWLRYSEVGRWTEGDDSGQAQLGTFYQVLDTAEWQVRSAGGRMRMRQPKMHAVAQC